MKTKALWKFTGIKDGSFQQVNREQMSKDYFKNIDIVDPEGDKWLYDTVTKLTTQFNKYEIAGFRKRLKMNTSEHTDREVVGRYFLERLKGKIK